MQSNCIVSVAFRQPYISHSDRQFDEINRLVCDCDYLYFSDSLPTKNGLVRDNIVETFQKSLYGFKPHAIQRAIDKGYKKIVWFDPSVLPTVSPNKLFDSLDTNPIIVRTGDQPIVGMVNKKALNWFGVTEGELSGVNHVGGTIYGFNFNDEKAVRVFELWKQAEESGIFGTQDEFMQGHWADEACMSLAMYKIGVNQYWEKEFTYLNQKEIESII